MNVMYAVKILITHVAIIQRTWKLSPANPRWVFLGMLCSIAGFSPANAHEGRTQEIRQVFGQASIAYYYDSSNNILFAEDLPPAPRTIKPTSVAIPHLPSQDEMPACPPASGRRVNAITKGAVLATYYKYNHSSHELDFLVAEDLSVVSDRMINIKCGTGQSHCTALHQCMSCGGQCCCQ